MWEPVGHSEIGTAHLASGADCQDYHEYRQASLHGEKVLLIGIADGAGSAAAARLAAEETVRSLLRSASRASARVSDIPAEEVLGWFRDARARLEEISVRKGLPLRELSSTVLLGVLGEATCLFAQVGDGAWVAEYRGHCEPVTWPTGGEHANETVFLSSPGWERHFQFERWLKPTMSVAGFTDGLERLFLTFATRRADAPILPQILSGLAAGLSVQTDLQDFQAPLIAFLQSEAVNAKTEDDKTLVIACRRKLALVDASS